MDVPSYFPDDYAALLIQCRCHSHHFLELYCDLDPVEQDGRCWYVTATVRPKSFLGRLRLAVRSLWGWPCIESMEIVLSGADARRLEEYMASTRAAPDRKRAA